MTIVELANKTSRIKHIYKVSPSIYYSFQQCTADYNPLHTDEQFAIKNGFDGCVMYGNILNGFISHFVGMLLPTRCVMIQAQDIMFHKPFYMGDDISLESKIDTVSEAVNIVRYKIVFKRCTGNNSELIARGHVQVGLLKEKEIK